MNRKFNPSFGLFSRKVIDWKLSDKPDTNHVIDTFKKAYMNRNCLQGLMFHSDRGNQYTSADFRKLLDKFNVIQYFSAKGYPFDNAVVESFFKFFKTEETNRKYYSSLADLKMSLFEYIDGLYKPKRPHSTIDYLSPNDFETKFFSSI